MTFGKCRKCRRNVGGVWAAREIGPACYRKEQRERREARAAAAATRPRPRRLSAGGPRPGDGQQALFELEQEQPEL